jgi:hypothetical protein
VKQRGDAKVLEKKAKPPPVVKEAESSSEEEIIYIKRPTKATKTKVNRIGRERFIKRRRRARKTSASEEIVCFTEE